MSSYLEFVADSPDRGDFPVCMILDLFAQTLDVYVYRAGVANVFIAPDLIQKLFSGKKTWLGEAARK